jgi:predicted nucleotidyltransferase
MAELNPIVREIVDATVAAVEPERIVLFGSRARGDEQPGSDLDLLVVAGAPFTVAHSRQDALRRIRRALGGVRIPVDILLYTPAEVDAWRDSPNHVIARSLREGVTAYERP